MTSNIPDQAVQQAAIDYALLRINRAEERCASEGRRYAKLRAAQAADAVRQVYPTAATVTFELGVDMNGPSITLTTVCDADRQPLWCASHYIDLVRSLMDADTAEGSQERYAELRKLLDQISEDDDAAGFEDDQSTITDLLEMAVVRGGGSFFDTDEANPERRVLHIDAALAAAARLWS